MKNRISSFIDYIKVVGMIGTIWYLIQRFLLKRDIIKVSVPGIQPVIHLRRQSKDVNVFHQIFIKQDLAFLKGQQHRTCVDAGANIGLSAIYMKHMMPDALIYCIEPEAQNLAMLKLNMQSYAGITIIPKALAENSDGVILMDTGLGSDAFQTCSAVNNTKGVRIDSTSMLDLMTAYNTSFDFVKMDIEGAEAVCVTKHALPWIAKCKVIAIEIHEHFVPGCTAQIMQVMAGKCSHYQRGEYTVFHNLQYQAS